MFSQRWRCRLWSCDSIWSCRWIPKFWRNLLSLPSGWYVPLKPWWPLIRPDGFTTQKTTIGCQQCIGLQTAWTYAHMPVVTATVHGLEVWVSTAVMGVVTVFLPLCPGRLWSPSRFTRGSANLTIRQGLECLELWVQVPHTPSLWRTISYWDTHNCAR
jgi:hypothetical protein